MSALFLAAAILTETTATMALRASEGFAKRAWIAPVVAGYVVSFFFLSLALDEGMALGVAYGIWSALGIAITAIAAHWLFDEVLNRTMVLGIGVIAVGVLIIELSSH